MRALPWILCLAAACDAGAKPEPAKAPVEAKKPAAPIPDRRPAAFDGFKLAYLPADSDVVVHVDVSMLRKSKLWATYASDVGKMIAPGFAGCNASPIDQVSSVDIGIPIDSKLTTFVVRGIDRDKALACFRDKNNSKTVAKGTFDGDYVTLTGATKTRVLRFVDDHTLVMQEAKAPGTQTLQSTIDAGTPLAQNRELAAAISRVKTSSAVTLVSRPGSEAVRKSMSQTGMKLSFLYASIDLTDQFALRYAMDLGTADEAAQTVKMIKAQMDSPSVKQMFDRFETASQDKTVTLEVVLGETKLASLAGMLRGLVASDD